MLIALGRFGETGVVPDGAPASGETSRTPGWACCETARAWTAREATGCALRTDLEQGLSTLTLSRCHKRMQAQGVGVQRPTRIAGRLRQRRLPHSSAPSTGRSSAV